MQCGKQKARENEKTLKVKFYPAVADVHQEQQSEHIVESE